MPPAQKRVVFLTDIVTPYGVAVFGELAKLVDLTVLYCSRSGTRALEWSFDDPLPFRHRVLGGLTVRRSTPDATDYYLSPRILAALVRARPEAIIVGGFSVPTLYAVAYATMSRKPVLIHSDGTSASEAGLGRLQHLARRALVPRVTGAIGNSEPAARRFAELGVPEDRIFEAPHSTGIEPFAEVGRGRTYAGREGRLELLGTGRLIPRKGFEKLVEAAAAVQQGGRDVRVTLAGSGPEEPRLRELARDLGVDLRLVGLVEQRDLPRLYAEADVYAFPTFEDPFGIVLLEAAAAGLPIVASPHGGATEDIVVDGVTGLVREPRDVASTAGAIQALADDEALRARLGRAAHRAVAHRTPASTAQGYARAVSAASAIAAASS